MQCVEMSHFEANCCLDWGFAILNEMGFLEPSLQHCAVGHGEGAVASSEAAGDDIHPWCDDCRNVFEQVVGCLEFKVWVKVISPHESFIAVST
jgi:hypothetical protein